ncbi:3'-5' exonuclease [Streptomyces sp. NPDC002491]
MTLPIAFVDCETTHLDAEIGEAWEVAVILRTEKDGRLTDTEHVWQFAIDRATADPEALRIGRFRERHLVDPSWGAAWTGPGPILPCSRRSAIDAIVTMLRGAVLVGSNPGFDERFLRKLVGPGGAQWHYRPYDIVQLAAAKIGAQAAGPLPWSSYTLSRAAGVEPPTEEAAHTALGDARWARDVHDAVMIREKFALSWEGRAQHAIGLYTQTACELDDVRRSLAVSAAAVERAEKLATQWAVLRTYGGAATELRKALAGPSQPVMTASEVSAPCTERSRMVAIADALNAAEDSGLSLGIDLDGTITDHTAWSVIWDPATERWTVAGYDQDDETPCTCTVGEACDQCADDDQDDEEPDEAGDADGNVFELISEIAARLRDATDEGEYQAVGLIHDLANGRTTIADARTELAEITFRHV